MEAKTYNQKQSAAHRIDRSSSVKGNVTRVICRCVDCGQTATAGYINNIAEGWDRRCEYATNKAAADLLATICPSPKYNV